MPKSGRKPIAASVNRPSPPSLGRPVLQPVSGLGSWEACPGAAGSGECQVDAPGGAWKPRGSACSAREPGAWAPAALRGQAGVTVGSAPVAPLQGLSLLLGLERFPQGRLEPGRSTREVASPLARPCLVGTGQLRTSQSILGGKGEPRGAGARHTRGR